MQYTRQASNHSTDIGLQRMEHDNRSADIGPQRMEYRPYSNPDNSESVRVESPVLSLTEHCVMNRAINHWEGQKYITYNTKDARLRSFVINDWPHDLNPAPNAFREAGLFFTCKNIHTLFNKLNSNYVLDLFNLYESVYSFGLSDDMFFSVVVD